MSEVVTSEAVISGALALHELYSAINRENDYESRNGMFSIGVGMGGRGTYVSMNLGNKRFTDLFDKYPINKEYGRLEITHLDKVYHVSYILPAYEDQVEVVTIAHSFEDLTKIVELSILENIQIIA